MLDTLTYKPYSEKAILIVWPAKIELLIHQDILRYKQIIHDNIEAIESLIVGYHSLLVTFKYHLHSFTAAIEKLKVVYQQETVIRKKENFLWEIPVCYDSKFGIDLEILTEYSGLKNEAIIRLHCEPVYRIYFMGFLPGFMYLGGLNERIHFSRKPTPRRKVPKGAVAIGGAQTGIYPQESAGGWHIIGNAPISFFDSTKMPPCFAKAGDQIRFQSITKKQHEEIRILEEHGLYNLVKKPIE